MGRPLNKKFFGDPSNPGAQIEVNVATGTTFILRQRTNNTYEVDDDGSGSSGPIKLVNDQAPTTVGEGSIVVRIGTSPGEESTTSTGMHVDTIAIVSAGSGWLEDDTLTIVGGTNSGATILVVEAPVGEGGPITGIKSVSEDGTYTALPSNPVATTGEGTGVTLDLTWNVITVSVTGGGSGYSSPTVSFTSNGEESISAIATASVEGSGDISGISVSSAGEGYTTVPEARVARVVTEKSIELVEKLQTHNIKTFQGNVYSYDILTGHSGSDQSGNVVGS